MLTLPELGWQLLHFFLCSVYWEIIQILTKLEFQADWMINFSGIIPIYTSADVKILTNLLMVIHLIKQI